MSENVLNLRRVNEIYWTITLPLEKMGVDAKVVMDNLLEYSDYFGNKVKSIMNMGIQFAIDIGNDLEFIDVDYPVVEGELSVESLEYCLQFFRNGFYEQYGATLEIINPKVILVDITFQVREEFPKIENYTRKEISQRLRVRVLDRDNSTCQLCGATIKDGVKLHVDHIIPLSKGGTNDMENLQTLCDKCNLGKGDFTDLNMVKRRVDDG